MTTYDDSEQPLGDNPDYDPSPEEEIRRLTTSRDRARRERDGLAERLQTLKIELMSVRRMTVNDRFDEGCQLTKFRDLADRWIPGEKEPEPFGEREAD